MAKRKTTTKKPTVTEPVIDYVDPETHLDMQIPDAEIDKAPESAMQSHNEFFKCMKRRRDKEQ